jgi:curli biogenesis system outer membrane secretion channel CsgG
MRGWGRVLAVGLGLVAAWGAPAPARAQVIAPKATVTSPEGKSIEEAQREAYDGPKARMAVARFTNKARHAGWWTAEIGDGMADMLATALFHTNRFIVLERQTLGDVLREQDLGAAGRIKRGTEAPIGEIEGAELLVTGAVTEFDPGESGIGGAIGGARGWGRILGGIAGGLKTAHMAIDVRVIDAKTSRLVAATSVEGKATDFNLGGVLAGAAGGGALGGALGGWSNTPKEKALRLCIQEAVNFIVSKTPAAYYRHRPVPVSTTAAVGAPAPAPGPAAPVVATATAPAAPAPAPAVASAPPADAAGAPPATKVLQTIRTDFDKDLILDLNEVKLRGAVLSVVVTLRLVGSKKESNHVAVSKPASNVLNYDTGETFAMINVDGFVSGRLAPGDPKTLRAIFKAPKDAKKVGITLSGLGTFDDVEIAP